MRNKETRKERIINSMEMVETSFKLLSDKRQIDELDKGIYRLLGKLGNSQVTELFDRYPRLMQKYSSKELFSGNIEIPNINSANLKIAGLLTYLQFLISSISDFIDQSGRIIPADEIKNDRSYQAEHYIINSIPLDDYIEHLFLTVVSATGEEYYRKFIEKTGNPDFTIDEIQKLENDTELQEHIDLMAWFGLVRILLESLYFYFNPENHNPKIN
ncbi:hypothetical protein B0A69_00815 [Chryseobacterium shigense]|uniref:Uncharacterized protein n=1 Tax=Chryseobacterium shigense TaxID=297244 RepID=A0A1N7JEK8_9FLAO|nr:hypothetical protein [Chryseobacterium shigense]PQA96666.1 hypothetical protein B0A69_00815 [Chryseobacterium shigense]SIS47740.1 hypothetical protein SAMN05421639_106109 [Chryseobacterium shigense]